MPSSNASTIQTTRTTCLINGLHVRADGNLDAPTAVVVAAHGLCLSSSAWARTLCQVRRTDPTVATVSYDHREHGRSADYLDTADAGLDSVADDLIDVLAYARTLGDRVVLIGHSMGAMAALRAAASGRLGGLVDSMILVSASSGALCEHGLFKLLPSAVTKGLPEFAQTHPTVFDAAWRVLRPALSPWLGLPAASGEGNERPPRPRAMVLATILASLRDWGLRQTELAAVVSDDQDIDVTVLCGRGDLITPLAHSEKIAAEIASANLVVIDGGHNLPLERGGAAACADVVLSALNALSSTEAEPTATA